MKPALMNKQFDISDFTIPDSNDPEKDQMRYGYAVLKGCYVIVHKEKESEKKKAQVTHKEDGSLHLSEKAESNQIICTIISNFVSRSLFNLHNGTNNSKRIFYLQNENGNTCIVEVMSSEMKSESFETILKTQQCTFLGNAYILKRIFLELMKEEKNAFIIESLGWNDLHQVYAWADALFHHDRIYRINELGIVSIKNKHFYLPAFGIANQNNADYAKDKLYQYKQGDLNFKTWAELYFSAYGNNGAIGIIYMILALFRDIVFNQVSFFPFLYLFGDFGTGKTHYSEKLLNLFGEDVVGHSMNNITTVAITRIFSARTNGLVYAKEYTNDTAPYIEDFILAGYDGSGRTTGIKSNDTKTKSMDVNSGGLFDGNYIPTKKTAILSRLILLIFDENKFSADKTEAFNKLTDLAKDGFGLVLKNVLTCRETFKEKFRPTYLKCIREVKEFENQNDIAFADRTLSHFALFLSVYDILNLSIPFPFSRSQLREILVENAQSVTDLLKESSVVNIFWEAFNYNVKNGYLSGYSQELQNAKKAHYRKKVDASGEITLQIKLQSIYPFYIRYCKDNNISSLDLSSLRMILTSSSNKCFIHNHQKGRCKSYTDFDFGACYQFSVIQSENGIIVNEVEINL